MFFPAPERKFGVGSVAQQFDGVPMDRNAIQRVAVVKLDGEGAEAAALNGLQRRLPSANAPAVIFEFVDWAETRIAGQAAGDAQAFLLQLGYRPFQLADDGKPSAAIE